MSIVIAILAHNEERRIAACLASLPLGAPGVEVHVLVNASQDATAAIARQTAPAAHVHDWPEGGKARTWNRFVHEVAPPDGDAYVFVDGDAEVLAGSVEALAAALAARPPANAAAAFPRNGRHAARYAAEMAASHGLFGDLYALSGAFLRRLRASQLRLPDDLIGDDSLIGALAKLDLGAAAWEDARILPCPAAGFLCEPVRATSPASLALQYRRMRAYALRRFQNRIISDIMATTGPAGLPRRMASLYRQWLPRLVPRRHPVWWWFDRQALALMRKRAG
ncbi:MAG TPA: glycosyltransferase family A protein [Novosphingobium sp.]|nr:glycosyltransferase family A protein [Novosphingobium sp.]HZV11132.1 glycosyltransferase family A protein [Novosphingobium sp.]